MTANNKKFLIFVIIFPLLLVGDLLFFSKSSGLSTTTWLRPNLVKNFENNKIEVPKDELKFLFFGDIMLDRHVKERIDKNGFDYLLASTSPQLYDGYDIVTANLEGSVTDEGAHYPPENGIDFAFNPTDVGALKKYNFNLFNLANNHFGDQGEKGINETKANLDKLGFDYFGCKDRQVGDCSSKIVEIKNKKIAFIGASMVYGIFDLEKLKAQIIELKKNSDLVIVELHWGVEYEHKFNKTQQEIAHELIDAGAEVIIGHHPHVVQGMEIYKNKAIFYSLGNFIFDQYFSADTQEGVAVSVNLDEKQINFHLIPYQMKAAQVTVMNEEKQKEFWSRFLDYSSEGNLGTAWQEGNIILSR